MSAGRPLFRIPRRTILNSRGAIAYKTLFWLLALGLFIYGAYKVVPPVLAYYMLKADVENEAKVAYMYSDETLAKRIMEKAGAWNIPLDREQIEISRGIENISIEVRYNETITYFGYHTKVYPVYIAVNRPLRESSKILQ